MAPIVESKPMDPTSTKEELKFKEILKSNGITDPVSEIIVKRTGLQGENFAGVTEYVTVKFQDEGKSPLHLFVKKKLDNPEYTKALDEFGAYEKESTFFMEYLPLAREYCKRLGQQQLSDIYPKCYHGDSSMIVLENLVSGRGFILLNKEEKQDFETAKLSLTNLATHHALSHALIQELGGPQLFFKRFPILKPDMLESEEMKKIFNGMIGNAVNTNINILEKCGMEEATKAAAKLKSLQGKQLKLILESIKLAPEDFLVLNHGDFWNNNMMFRKDEGTGKIVEHVPIDFQTVRYSSPSTDIAYYMYTSVKAKVRRSQGRELFTVYLDALKRAGNRLGHPIDYSLEEFEADFRKHFYLGYWLGLNLATGVGYEAMKGLDANESSDLGAMLDKWDQLIVKWADEHPEECKVNAVEIVEYVKEYERWTTG